MPYDPEKERAKADKLAQRALDKAIAAGTPTPVRRYSLGESGEGVRGLQNRLVIEGKLTEGTFATGIYDKATRAATEGD